MEPALRSTPIQISNNFKNLLYLAWLILLLAPIPVSAQADSPENELIDLGPISFSPDYNLSKDKSFIIFTIRNNTTRSIRGIFAWIYEFNEDENNVPVNFRLANNPHKGGLSITGEAHVPGALTGWRFPLTPARLLNDKSQKFILRASPKGIFFSTVEPRGIPAE